MTRGPALAACLLALAACAPPDRGQSTADGAAAKKATGVVPDNLPAFFDCLRTQGLGIAAAHRGGPDRGLPENALETLEAGYRQGVRLFEVDVATGADGVLFLMHDDTLERTSTGVGPVGRMTAAGLPALRLKDPAGAVTGFAAPLLAQALAWAVTNGAILELDIKTTTRFETVVDAVRAASAERHVVFITYDAPAARRLMRLAPGMMISAPFKDLDPLPTLAERGFEPDRLLAWTGLKPLARRDYRRLANFGLEPILGTLGRRGERLDDSYLADGDPSDYVEAVTQGVVVLASDKPNLVARTLKDAGRGPDRCLTERG